MKVLKQQPENLHTLIWQSFNNCIFRVSSSEFHVPALNRIRFTRVVPAIFESIDDDPVTASFAERVFWQKSAMPPEIRPQ